RRRGARHPRGRPVNGVGGQQTNTGESMDTNGHTTTETAIALRQPTAMAAFEPRTFDQAMAMAEKIAKSGLLGDLNTPEKVFLVMATGAELGIPLTAALRGIHIIKGK